MKRTVTPDALPPLPPEQADRIDSLFDSIEPTDHARRIIALADLPEMASDSLEWELMHDESRS